MKPLAPDKLFESSWFKKSQKPLEISKKQYHGIQCVRLLLYNNFLLRHILISPTVFEVQGSEKSQKTPPPQILWKYCPDCAVHHLQSIPSKGKYFIRTSTRVKTFLKPLATDNFFNNSFFFSKYLQNRRRYRKYVQNQICRSLNCTMTRAPLLLDIFNSFRDMRVQRIAKITPLPIVLGNIGPTVQARGGFRFEAHCNIHRNFHSNRSTCS